MHAIVYAIVTIVVNSVSIDEDWIKVSTHIFSVEESSLRRQGIASDSMGRYWYSSFHSILSTTDMTGSADVLNLEAIPRCLSQKYGSDHIGDIDYFNGLIYAPIEDEGNFSNPFVVSYDAYTLNEVQSYPLLQSEQIDGVPWLAIDPEAQQLLTSQYTNVSQINIYDISNSSTMPFVGHIILSTQINAIQGGCVFQGNLYMSANSQPYAESYSIYKLDMSSGEVQEVIGLELGIREIEGVTITAVDNKIFLDVLAIKEIDKPLLNALKIRIAEVITYVNINKI